MFTHITVGCSDIPRAVRFYDAVLNPLGIARRESESPTDEFSAKLVCWKHPHKESPLFFVVIPFDDQAPSAGNGCMVAFAAASAEQVDRSYQQGLAAGGTDEGPPGLRPHYAEGYYGAYLRDPEGNKIHVVYPGD